MAGKPVPGRIAIVLDGDGRFTGIAMAELLADQGKEVTLVTNMHDVVQYSLYTMEMANNKRLLYQKGIKTYTNHWGQDYRDNILTMFYLYRDSAALTEYEPDKWGRTRSSDLVTLDCDALVLVTTRVPEQPTLRWPEGPTSRVAGLRNRGRLSDRRLPCTETHHERDLRRSPSCPRVRFAAPPVSACHSSASARSGEPRPIRSSGTPARPLKSCNVSSFPGWPKQANLYH